MNLDSLRNKLLAAARADAPSDQVPIAFEKRVLAHLRPVAAFDPGALWTRMLWRSAAPCVAFALAIGAWSYLGSHAASAASPASETAALPQDFEQMMLAVVEEQAEELW